MDTKTKRVTVTFSYVPANEEPAQQYASILDALQDLNLRGLILATPLVVKK